MPHYELEIVPQSSDQATSVVTGSLPRLCPLRTLDLFLKDSDARVQLELVGVGFGSLSSGLHCPALDIGPTVGQLGFCLFTGVLIYTLPACASTGSIFTLSNSHSRRSTSVQIPGEIAAQTSWAAMQRFFGLRKALACGTGGAKVFTLIFDDG
ncbi:hypothetical protein EI94DRAFT_1812790 [Lactarius quietus]|nr:hypothetical protein EI94DRAFT_1812790 [Lactarius quietus]